MRVRNLAMNMVLAVLICILCSTAQAARKMVSLDDGARNLDLSQGVPGLINYQGTLTDEFGVALDTTVSMTFSIYPLSVGGTALWTETQPAVVVSSGIFNVLLGSVNSIPDTVFSEPVRWLGVQVGGDPELVPRQRIASVGYAFWAAEADSADYARSGGGSGGWVDDGTVVRLETDTDSVGIGITAPVAKLDVSGDININSVYKIGGETVLSTEGTGNVLVGAGAGENNTGSNETFVGFGAGENNEGNDNTFVGRGAGKYHTTGSINTYLGTIAGYFDTEGNNNTFIGGGAGLLNTTGSENTYLGTYAGNSNQVGVGNVFLGYQAGYNETDSSKLYIANGPDTSDVLIYGNFSTSKVGLGTLDPAEKLDVAGTVRMEGFKMPTGASDGYVLTSDALGEGTWKTPSASATDNDWVRGTPDSVLFTANYLGVARGDAGNMLFGDSVHTHINLGVACTTGNTIITTRYCTVGGGLGNIARHNGATVGGGYGNAAGFSATVGGGSGNNAGDDYATVGGGGGNTVFNEAGTVGGGHLNTAGGSYATVGGGKGNTVSGQYATVGGGGYSTAIGSRATVGGGGGNYVGGAYSAILGGYQDSITAAADYSYLFGIGSKLTQDSTFMVDMPHIRFGDETDGYEFPASDRSNGQLLVTDGSGTLSWQAAKSDVGNWAISGNNLHSTVSGNVGIGTTRPARALHINDVMRLEPRSSAPASPAEGDMYMDSVTHKLMVYDGAIWQACW